jgi:hypothetical protein
MDRETTAERPEGSGARSRPVEIEDQPRVTASMLRRVDACCHRRLAREHAGGKRHANKAGDARFAVQNRLVADARLAHAAPDTVRPEAFVDPRELAAEQRHLYRAGVRGYLTMFGERPGRLADVGWRTALRGLGVDLVGDIGVALELPDGTCEVRILKLGGRRAARPLLDRVELQCVLLRTEAWARQTLRVIVADLIEQEVTVHDPDLVTERRDAWKWVSERVELVRRAAAHGQPRAGADCNGCGFVAGCEAHA